MKEMPSNNPEMDALKALSHIKKVEVRDSLFEEITSLIPASRVISMFQLRAAAAVILCLVSLNIYVVSKSSVTSTTEYSETLIPLSSNSLYND